MSIDVIEMARANNVTLLCLPAHTSHVLQPLDVGVFKPFKTAFNKACSNNILVESSTHVLASIVALVYEASFTTVNVLSGFKKGVYPFNPSEIDDRQLAPSTAFQMEKPLPTGTANHTSSHNTPDKGNDPHPRCLSEKEALFAKHYEEQYDVLNDVEYNAWIKIQPDKCLSVCKGHLLKRFPCLDQQDPHPPQRMH